MCIYKFHLSIINRHDSESKQSRNLCRETVFLTTILVFAKAFCLITRLPLVLEWKLWSFPPRWFHWHAGASGDVITRAASLASKFPIRSHEKVSQHKQGRRCQERLQSRLNRRQKRWENWKKLLDETWIGPKKQWQGKNKAEYDVCKQQPHAVFLAVLGGNFHSTKTKLNRAFVFQAAHLLNVD